MQTLGHISQSAALGLFFWNQLPANESIIASAREVVYRDEAEAAIKTVSDELAGALRQLETAIKKRDDAVRQAEGWMESAASFSRGQDFYHGLITEMGEVIGKPAYTSDDGSIQQEVLALKVRDIVLDAFTPKTACAQAHDHGKPSFGERLRYGLRIIFTGK